MYIIVGLGNPGKKYENTRHNMGFLTIDVIAEKLGIKVDRIKFKSLVGETNYAGQKVILVKPQTYMNLSGQAVREIMNFYKVPVENLIVIYDDIDIAVGKLRIRKKGSAGTHNGMRDIVYQIQDDNFPRIRVGIGAERKGDLVNFVIGGFSKEERPLLEDSITKAADASLAIIKDGIEKAMNAYNVREKKPKERAEKQHDINSNDSSEVSVAD
ncbi:MAG: aminoacyl-tRNA hydrolase [Firmicutes bacterium]|nr:aminoacyl-tRNA hydrolase [Bacillota bacterium]MBQ3123638.1 aminoacyl-tRNA hydrolase [Bacillota bacterium]MBQ9972708.1 aminoacyl-tRNA hydrolase [Bacillota bacterium]